MSRQLDNKEVVLYRAVIKTVYTPEPGFEEYGDQVFWKYAGPYARKGDAVAAITRAKRPKRWDPPGNYTATGHVEVTVLEWQPDGPAA